MKKIQIFSIASLLSAQLMVGVGIVGAKCLLASLPALTILTIRFTFSSVFLFIIHLIFRTKNSKPLNALNQTDWLVIVCQALCAGAFFNALFYTGLNYTSANVAGIITSALPAMVAVFSIIFLKEKVTRSVILSITLAVLGLLILNASSFHDKVENNLFGDIIILISLIPEALYYVLARAHHSKLPVFLISALMNGINVPIFLGIIYFSNAPLFPPLSLFEVSVIITISLASGLFYVFWFLGCEHVDGIVAGVVTAFMPISTLFFAWLFLSEKISLVQAGGMSMVLLSIFVIAADKKRQQAAAPVVEL